MTATRVVDRGRRPASEYFPYSLFALATLAIVLVLPTALRPPQQPPSTTAQFSPDAPPDETQEAIISSLGRASSGGSGGGAGGPEATVDEPGPPPTTLPPPPSFCPGGFGEPPRQVESLYAAPCAPAFTGDNGGDTYQGVTGSEIRIALIQIGPLQAEEEGPIPTEPSANEGENTRTYRVFQEYFNRNFQFYGRRLQLYETNDDGSGDYQRGSAIEADEVFRVFGCKCHDPVGVQEMSRRGLVAFGGITSNGHFLERNDSFLWAMDATKASRLAGEYLCKKLHGKPPAFNERMDPTFNYDEPRIFGFSYFEKQWSDAQTLIDRFAECGGKFKVALEVTFDPTSGQEAQANLATAIARMRVEGVTTILHVGTSIEMATYNKEADHAGYFPEWVICCGLGLDRNDIARALHSPTQWRHAFGLSPGEIPRPLADTDCVRAYRSIDPTGMPASDLCGDHYGVWGSLLMIANGIQMAGPNLNPDSFEAGLAALGKRPPKPVWSIGGGYGPGDRSYGDYVAELWWDPDAIDPIDGTSRGAYRYTRGGKRYTVGEIPTEDPLVFQEGVTTVQ